jgi:hypothetical protein
VSLESEYDLDDELAKKYGRNSSDCNDSASITFCSTIFWPKISNGHKTKSIYSHDTINVSLESEYDPDDELAKNKNSDCNDLASITFCSTIFRPKISNGHKTKSIYSHDTINVSLESEYNPEDELAKNIGGTIANVMIRHQLLFAPPFFGSRSQMAIKQRVSTRMTQYRCH